MSFQQLYYTSCEHGLSGYAGYQFNAVTDGTSGETMRAVESLTSYEPPRSAVYATTREELERCPVSLCFEPGETDIVANVRYVGRDSSRRFGNYFAHALATSDFGAEAGEVLPIELWRAPWWDCCPATTTVLPSLAGPLHPGPLCRERIADFLARHPNRDRLPMLLSAVGRAQRRADRSALVVAESTDDVANWFAAICYSLPPRWVRYLSFSTYLSRPSRSRLHLLGTVPETDLDLGPDADARFYLFDFPGARFADLEEHPLARLCVAIGLMALPALWGWTDSLASGGEATLDDWHPVVAAAAALGGVTLKPADLAVTTRWLTERGDLTAGTQRAIARALMTQPAVTVDVRQAVRDISARAGDGATWELAQYELLEPLLRRRVEGTAVAAALAPHPVPEVVAAAGRVRGQLTAAAEEQLRLSADPADSLELLDWAGHAQLPVGPTVLAEAGRAMLGPLLTADPGGRRLTAAQRDQLTRVADRWPAMRAGIAAHLVAISGREPTVIWAAMSGITGTLLTARDLTTDSPLRVPYLAWRELRRGEPPVRILSGLARRADIASTDDLLLTALWPTGAWPLADASHVLAEVDTRVLSGALDWFEATLASMPTPEGGRDYARLCDALVGSSLAGQLAAPAHPALGEVAKLHQHRAKARSIRELVPAIKATRSGATVPARVLAREWLGPVAARLPAAAPHDVVDAIRLMPPPVAHRYLIVASERFASPDAGAAMQAAAFWLIATSHSEWARAYDKQLGEILGYAARRWPRPRIDQAATLIDVERKGGGQEFRDWAGLVRSGRLAWLVKAIRLLRALRPGRRATDATGGTER